MWQGIVKAGLIAGAIAGGGMALSVGVFGDALGHGWAGMAVGYAIMLVALTAVFLGVKRQRDGVGGGVIRFWPAFGIGLAISGIAAALYALAWEVTQALLLHGDFAANYAAAAIAERRAEGASAAELARLSRDLAEFTAQYRDPLFRLPMTFLELFPVGVLVSLLSAALLRNSRLLPARGQPA